MPAMDIVPQGLNSVPLLAGGNGNTKPGVVKCCREVYLLRSFCQEQVLMLGILRYLFKYFIPPLRLPTGKITHSCEKEILRSIFFHESQFLWEVLWYLKVWNHVKSPDIVPCVAVAAPDGAANYQVDILNQRFDTDRHWNLPPIF